MVNILVVSLPSALTSDSSSKSRVQRLKEKFGWLHKDYYLCNPLQKWIVLRKISGSD